MPLTLCYQFAAERYHGFTPENICAHPCLRFSIHSPDYVLIGIDVRNICCSIRDDAGSKVSASQDRNFSACGEKYWRVNEDSEVD